MIDFLSVTLNLDPGIVHATIRIATPIIFAALAAVLTQNADILNVGIEGSMLCAAFTAVYVSNLTGNWLLAVLCAVIVGTLVSFIIAICHLKFNADIFAVGMTVNLMAIALTRFLLQVLLGTSGSFKSPKIANIPTLSFKFLEGNEVLNKLFNNYNLFEILAIVLTFAVWFLLYKTVWGLRTRSIGMDEKCAVNAGINVVRRKYEVIIYSGILSGLGGAYMSIGLTSMFVENMTNNRGFLGVAAMFFGSANPVFSTIGAVIFGFFEAVGLRIDGIKPQLILIIPYVIIILVLSFSMYKKKYSKKKATSSISYINAYKKENEI